jgi:hypothetical protein
MPSIFGVPQEKSSEERKRASALAFLAHFAVKGAVVVSYASVWDLVPRQAYNRISFTQACQLPGAVDITAAVHAAAERC